MARRFATQSIGRSIRAKEGNVAQELHQTRAVLVLRYLFERRLANFDFFFETSNGRLPPEHGSDRCETLAKRVSDDLQFFIFRRRKLFF